MTDKVKAVIAHITLFGWIIAMVLYFMGEKTKLTQFYLRQMLGILLIGFVINLITFPPIAVILSLTMIGLWVYSLIGAAKEEEWPLPYIGQYFQQWFTFI